MTRPVPVLAAAGIRTGAGAALMRQSLPAVAAGPGVGALGPWWPHRRRDRTVTGAGGRRPG
jgi:hypothetical protein